MAGDFAESSQGSTVTGSSCFGLGQMSPACIESQAGEVWYCPIEQQESVPTEQ